MQRADDTLGDAVLLAERAANRDRQLPDLQRAGVSKAQRGQALRIDLQHRDVVVRTRAHHASVVGLRLVAKDDLQLPGVFNHVVVRHDVAVRADDESRADPMLLLLDEQVWRGDGGLDLDHRLAVLVGDADHGRFFGEIVVDRRQRRHHSIPGGRDLDPVRRQQDRCRGSHKSTHDGADHNDGQRPHSAARLHRALHRHRRQWCRFRGWWGQELRFARHRTQPNSTLGSFSDPAAGATLGPTARCDGNLPPRRASPPAGCSRGSTPPQR